MVHSDPCIHSAFTLKVQNCLSCKPVGMRLKYGCESLKNAITTNHGAKMFVSKTKVVIKVLPCVIIIIGAVGFPPEFD